MLAIAITSGLAAFTVWHAIARVQPPGVKQLYAKLPDPVRSFVSCGWCGAFWIAAIIAVAASWALGELHPVLTPVVVFAAGGIPGVLDAFTPDDGSVI